MYRAFSGGVKYSPIHRRTFDLIRGPRCTGSECVIEMMASAPWPVCPAVTHEGVSCVAKAKPVRDTG
jgi:hypothetical protein